MSRIQDIKLGLKLAICYINYGRCGIKRALLIDKKVITIKDVVKIKKLDLKLAKIKVTIDEIESLV